MKSAVLFVSLILAWGCSGSPAPRPAPAPLPAADATGPGASVEVPITVDATALPAERRAAFDQLGGAPRLAAAVREETARTGRRPVPTGAQLDLVVTGFRLRSTATSVWFGGMAGADKLDVTVRVMDRGQEVRRFDTGAGTIVGGLIRPGAEGRFERVLRTTAERVVAGL